MNIIKFNNLNLFIYLIKLIDSFIKFQFTGAHFLYETENKLHKPSCTEVYYPTGLQSTESNMLLELFAQIIFEPCFSVLRTDEQLGYIVWSGLRRTNAAQGLRLIVQSDKHPQYVEERMDKFMASMQVRIKNILRWSIFVYKIYKIIFIYKNSNFCYSLYLMFIYFYFLHI